jgi:hypothetical protein
MTITELLIIARIIKNATAEDENSAIRVGGLLEEIVKYLHAVESGTTGGGGGGLWGTIEGVLSDQTDLNTELKRIDQIKWAEQIVTDDDYFEAISVGGSNYSFESYFGTFALVNRTNDIFTYNGLYEFVEEDFGSYIYKKLTSPTFVKVGTADVYYPIFMGGNGTSIYRWKKIVDGGYTPPAPAELITLTEEDSVYYVSDATPSVIAVFAETTGTIVLPVDEEPDTPTANKAVTIIITGGSGDIEVNSTVYEAGQTLFLFYVLENDVWTVNVAIDPVIPDIKDLFVSKKIDDFVFEITGEQDPIEADVAVGDVYKTTTDLGMATDSLLFLYQPNVETDDYNQIGIYQYIGSETIDDGIIITWYYYRCLILGQDLNIVRVANDKVYHNQYNGTDLSTLEFREIQENIIEEIQVNGTPLAVTDKSVNIECAPPLGEDDNYVGDELLENISNIPTIDPVDGDEYSFMTEKGTYKTISIQTLTLELEDWDINLQQTKTVAGIADKIIEMTAVAESTSLNFTEAAACQLRILEDLSTVDDLVFQVENLPEIDLTVKIKTS